MPADTRDVATRNRQVRQEALREYIANQRHEQEAFDAIGKMRDAVDPFELSKWEKVFNAHVRLLDKYLPATKEVSVEADVKAEMGIYEIERRIVKAPDPNG